MSRRNLVVVCFLALLLGCGSSGLPGGDQTINVSTSQDQDNNQVQNESEIDCTRSCSLETDGGSNLNESCKGGASSVIAAFGTFDECRGALGVESESDAILDI